MNNKVNISFDKPFDYSIFIPYNCGILAINELGMLKHQTLHNNIKYDNIRDIVLLNGYEPDNKTSIIGINNHYVIGFTHYDHKNRMWYCPKHIVIDHLSKTSTNNDKEWFEDNNENNFILFELVNKMIEKGEKESLYSYYCGHDRIQMSKSFYIDDNSKSFRKFEDCYNISRVCKYDHECNLNDCTTLKWRTI